MFDKSGLSSQDNWFEQEKAREAKISVWEFDGKAEALRRMHHQNCDAEALRNEHAEVCEVQHSPKNIIEESSQTTLENRAMNKIIKNKNARIAFSIVIAIWILFIFIMGMLFS